LSYTLIRSRRRKKTLSLQIRRDGSVVIQAPFRTPLTEIDHFYEDKKQWLQKKIAHRQRQKQTRQPRTYQTGERFLYLGSFYPLTLLEERPAAQSLTFTGQEFILSSDRPDGNRVLFGLWYQRQARAHLEERVRHFSRFVQRFPSAVGLSNARSRWGSCSPENRLTFAWRLIMAPPEVIDYVVVHEVSHMVVRNHSGDYWRLVEHILPDYKGQRAWLKEHGHRLVI
jgi:predicted metal-dependent hydrolase